jgi:hypothetical protein
MAKQSKFKPRFQGPNAVPKGSALPQFAANSHNLPKKPPASAGKSENVEGFTVRQPQCSGAIGRCRGGV